MAALNPRMLRLAGEVADGVLLNYIPASHVGPSIEHVRAGGDATVFAYVHAAVGDFERRAGSAPPGPLQLRDGGRLRAHVPGQWFRGRGRRDPRAAGGAGTGTGRLPLCRTG